MYRCRGRSSSSSRWRRGTAVGGILRHGHTPPFFPFTHVPRLVGGYRYSYCSGSRSSRLSPGTAWGTSRTLAQLRSCSPPPAAAAICWTFSILTRVVSIAYTHKQEPELPAGIADTYRLYRPPLPVRALP
mmetsp:Transcript_27996/g.61434  ORF Transcript_27996/g.61434 Transcript_27996/m.61434 type:complete len:130 (-) Transcript_27996:64-453(-)